MRSDACGIRLDVTSFQTMFIYRPSFLVASVENTIAGKFNVMFSVDIRSFSHLYVFR